MCSGNAVEEYEKKLELRRTEIKEEEGRRRPLYENTGDGKSRHISQKKEV